MKLNLKIYKINKIENFIKSIDLFFFFNGINKKASDWITTEQEIRTLHFKYHKILNKIALKTFKNSVFKNFKHTISGINFFIFPFTNQTLIKKSLVLNKFKLLKFELIAIKLNNKIYSIQQLSKIYFTNYQSNKLLLYQFGIANLKIYFE